MPVVLMLIGGGQALDHIQQLRTDQVLAKLLELHQMPDPGTLGDWLVRMYTRGYAGLDQVNQWLIERILAQDPRTTYTFDPDATGIESHKRTAEMTYKGYPGYMPMLGALVEVPVWLVDDFRPGNRPPQAEALAILDKALQRMPAGKRIGFLRSDSAWYQADIFNRCEQRHIVFAVTADQDKAVKDVIATLRNWQPVRERKGGFTDREWAEGVHCMSKTKNAFRLIVQRWLNPNRHKAGESPYCYHAIATNDPEKSAQEVIHWHNGRASSENFNKELKLGFGMNRLPCGDFGANAMYFRIGVLAYNLIVAMKALLLPPVYQRKTLATMRWLWLQTPAKLVSHGRQWILKITSPQLLHWWQRLRSG